MRKTFSFTIAGLMIAASVAVSSASFAEPPAGKGKPEAHGSKSEKMDKHANKGENKKSEKMDHADKSKIEKSKHAAIASEDMKLLRDFLKEDHAKNCPPGLAKKENGCLPPGIAKKYTVGKPLPSGVNMSNLPASLLNKLHPAAGHKYGKIDNDIVLISEATKKVVDAVTLLTGVQ